MFKIAALYRFVSLPDYESLKAPILAECEKHGLSGTLLLACEGLNGTIAGKPAHVDTFLDWLKAYSVFKELEVKYSESDEQPFLRMKVKLKKEIVTMGVEGIDPKEVVGTYVEPSDWNSLISDPGVLVVDTRNEYEIEIGTFKNAVNPKTQNFREFPRYVSEQLDRNKHKKIAMFCTGGIRCEKSTALLKGEGFEEVYHLKGGILKYLEEIPKSESLWEGECFVFDSRVAVNHDLNPGQYDQCFGCRYPVTAEDKLSEHYEQGICCPRCYSKLSDDQRLRFSERQKQIELAKARGEKHIGVNPKQ